MKGTKQMVVGRRPPASAGGLQEQSADNISNITSNSTLDNSFNSIASLLKPDSASLRKHIGKQVID